MEGEGEISLATEEAAVGPLVNGEQSRGVEAVAVGGEAGGSQRHEEIDLENSDAPESQPWELPSPLPRLAVLRLDNARLRTAFAWHSPLASLFPQSPSLLWSPSSVAASLPPPWPSPLRAHTSRWSLSCDSPFPAVPLS